MESSLEPVSVRVARINAEIIGKGKNIDKGSFLNRETVLDALQVLYDECSNENLQKLDSNIANFAKKYKSVMKDINSLRVNICDFDIKKIIGCGHFGEVHIVKEKQTGDVYALKTIRKFDNDISRMSYQEERNIMAFSNSPWLTKLQYSFQDSTYLFFVMDFHPGGDLLGLLYRNGGTLPESASLFYIAEIILALEDLHNMGYVHRDIKPDNVLLDRCGHIKLADFGSAAKLDKDGSVKSGPPVGTPDYIAPEVLQCLDNKNSKPSVYGISCDFWSLGVLAYELTIGNPPFQGHNSTMLYSKILNHPDNLKFPPEVCLTQGYVNFIKALLTDAKSRLKPTKIKSHSVFKNTNFDTLKDQVPPFVPKVNSQEDASNFTDVQAKKKHPSIENFRKRSQFSGRNLPFIGFTFTPDSHDMAEPRPKTHSVQNTETVENLKSEVQNLRMALSRTGDLNHEKEDMVKKVEETTIRLHSMEALRDKLEKELAERLAETTALKRTLEIERKDRVNLEKKAMDLIKGAKLKWELSEKTKVGALDLEIKQLKEKIDQLNSTNQTLNEQLQHALKMEEQGRKSVETERSLTRRSVIGLENLLEKVATDKQSRITELERKLNVETAGTTQLQRKIIKLEEELKQKETIINTHENALRKSKSEHDALKRKLQENERLIGDLSSKVNDLEKDLERIDDYESELITMRRKFEDSQKTIKDLQNKSVVLENERHKLESLKLENRELSEKTQQMQSRINALESDLEREKEQVQSYKKRLEESQQSGANAQEMKDRLQSYKMQKELSDCKIDKRILERELKGAAAEIKELQSKLKCLEQTLADNKTAHEAVVLELSGINENLSMELVKFQENSKTLQNQLENEKTRMEGERAVIRELKGFLDNKEDTIHNLENHIASLQNEVSNMRVTGQKEETEKSKLISLVEQLQKEKQHMSEAIGKEQSKLANMNVNLEALREACTLLEGQVVEFEKLVDLGNKKQAELIENREKLLADLSESRTETQEAKRKINEEKSLRALAESKVRRLQEDIECLEKECADYKSQCMEYKQFSSNLSEDLTVVEEKLSSADVTLKSYERQLEKVKSENHLLKEEMSSHITKISELKDSKYSLAYKVEDLNKTVAMLRQKLYEAETTLSEKTNYYKEREMKAEARDKQHLKLIDYLQSKVEELSHKKRTLTEVIFGSSKKENHPPMSLALNYKDLESELCKEKENSRKLKEEIIKLKAATYEGNSIMPGKKHKSRSETLSPKSKATLDQLVRSPNSQKESIKQNSITRMHHNIPHRFDTKLGTIPQKCAQCSNQIPLGKHYQVCKECKVVTHVTCSQNLPQTCGLPKEFAQHYKETLDKCEQSKRASAPPKSEALYEGWIKMPCKKTNSWVKRYARLTKCSLDIYNESPPLDKELVPIETFPFKPEGDYGKVILEPLQSEIGVPIAQNDSAFVIKVEIASETTCWPSRCIIIMTLDDKERGAWFAALQTQFASVQVDSKVQRIVKIPEGLTVNCLIDLNENIKLLGTDEGLYSYYNNSLFHLGARTRVDQLTKVPKANQVLMIEGTKGNLISCDIKQIITLTECAPYVQPRLKFVEVNVNNLNGFYFLHASKYSSQNKVAVATQKQLVILEFYLDTNEYIPVSILDTAQPTSCLLFTENSLIVGADKFFEIDLISFRPDEFLDGSDVNLKQTFKCHKIGSFPISIVEINDNPREFLVSFNEFSVFVDEYGRSSRRKELKHQHLPRAQHLADDHYLYTVQFAAVEILKITNDVGNTDDKESYRLELSKFKFLGGNSKGIFIESGDEIGFVSARNLPDFDAVSLTSSSTEVGNDSNNSRFSFTSSVVQSLDGNLSDTSNEDQVIDALKRKVQFDQTDL